MNVTKRPIMIGIGGFASGVGKTTLMCELLKELNGWEAIKTTRGHYRSCGKDPHACCVSHLLGEQAVVRSGRESTFASGKDTGRYWDAGASNVHWVIATDDQVEAGTNVALARVKSEGVLIEGNSFSAYVPLDYFVMVAGAADRPIKRSAREAMGRANAIYCGPDVLNGRPDHLMKVVPGAQSLPIYTLADIGEVLAEIVAKRSEESFVLDHLPSANLSL